MITRCPLAVRVRDDFCGGKNRRQIKMAIISMKQLLEAGVHFGHQTRRWNPKMAPYIFTERNGIYITTCRKPLKKLKNVTTSCAMLLPAAKIFCSLVLKNKLKKLCAKKLYAATCSM